MNTNTDIQAAIWWRRLCEVTDRLFVCGDLPMNPHGVRQILEEWVQAGVTHIVGLRGAANAWLAADEAAAEAPSEPPDEGTTEEAPDDEATEE